MRLKYYGREAEEFKDYKPILVKGQHEVLLICGKLCRHFSFNPISITFQKQRPDTGTFFYEKRTRRPLRLDFHRAHVSIPTLCHEVAHYFDFMRNRQAKARAKAHTKKHKTWTRRLLKYCEKRGYWGLTRSAYEVQR